MHSHDELTTCDISGEVQPLVNRVNTAIEAQRRGQLVLIIDDEIEGEGDVCIPAQQVTPQLINFMITTCRGLVCQSISPEMAAHLELPLMVPHGISPAFTVSVDAARVGSGTSAFDRATTAQTLVHPETRPNDLVRPGHVFPLIARGGGVLERAGHTEASSDLAALAGFAPSAVICEVLDDEGHMAGPEILRTFATMHTMSTLTVRDLITYRRLMNPSATKRERAG
ncbi:3,4-dihydroxy-2-butanone-4-phosphate synthase [Candidatus Entotheonella palauensis]|uniref:3,4-dihydroxy-2-butanone-4-phosphate synthase n=1 Tax=Candidatus Entotheonella palauensis TaxID=93172 RepID=UPI000B7D4FF7|nr:3,4-dihydroxy-2-butanone-4-phosphate synthase [Candidatus Entotheonella palauensis]